MPEKEITYEKKLKIAQEQYLEKESRMDAQYVNLQNEYTALNKLLESVQNDKVSTIDAPQVSYAQLTHISQVVKMKEFEQERERFREKLNEVTQFRQLEADSFHESESQYKLQRARLGDDLQRMEEELQAVLSSHVHEGHIASENSKLKTEVEAAQSEIELNLKLPPSSANCTNSKTT